MIIYLIILLISFFLDGIMSNYFTSINLHISLFNTIYSVIAFSCIANYFSNKKKYIILIGLTGLCFDIVYTNTFLLNVFIFIILGLNSFFIYGINIFLILFLVYSFSKFVLSILGSKFFSLQ